MITACGLVIPAFVIMVVCKLLRKKEKFSEPGSTADNLTSKGMVLGVIVLAIGLYASVFGPVQAGPIAVSDWPWLKTTIGCPEIE